MFDLIEIKKKEGIVIAEILENKSAKWDMALMRELYTFIEHIKRDHCIQVVIFVQKRGGICCMQRPDKSLFSPVICAKQRDDLFNAIKNFRLPTIAVMEGGVSGDYLEFSFMCDFRLIAEDTQLNFCFENGALPSRTGVKKVFQLVGEMRSKELFFTGKILNARSAVQIGLVNKIAAQERLMAESIEFAKAIKLTGSEMIDYVEKVLEKKQKTFYKGGDTDSR